MSRPVTPNSIREAAERASKSLLPEKSKGRYELVYQGFKDWCRAKKVNTASENVVLAYFSELSRVKKSSTLWATYSMLRKTLHIKENIDISQYAKLQAYLRKQNVGYQPKKSSVLTAGDVTNFLNNAPHDSLAQKVALIIGISGACRTDELLKMKKTDVDILENRISVVIPNTKTYQPRSFVITNLQWINIVKEYIALRRNVECDRFFLQLRNGKITKQPFGHNSIAQFPKKIANFLKLPNAETYTGHCFRRTAATLLADKGGDILQLKRLGGWKSSGVAESYVNSSVENQVKTAQMLAVTTETADETNNVMFSVPSTSTQAQTQHFNFPHDQIKHGLTFTINTFQNSTVNINFNNENPKNDP